MSGASTTLVAGIAVLLRTRERSSLVSDLAEGQLPCGVESSKNNLQMTAMKIGLYRNNASDNVYDALLFPTWFVEYSEAMMAEVREDSPGVWQAMLHRLQVYSAAIATDAEAGHVHQVVHVGVGFDTKLLPYADDPDFAAMRFYELDFPDVIAARRCLLDQFDRSVSQRLDLLALDLNVETVHGALDLAASNNNNHKNDNNNNTSFNMSQPASFIEESTFMYLNTSRRTHVVRDLLALGACGSRFHMSVVCSDPSSRCVLPLEFAGKADLLRALGTWDAGQFKVWTFDVQHQFSPHADGFLAMGFSDDVTQVAHCLENNSWSWYRGLMTLEKLC
ncbi:unnamed protein product [Polarella glacialis]|uniref:Uncharacterized protein n=1 Tax=Polarella glacialis TaxID=89957 RepID=A0A813LIH4_POLGL|nr:unnamed protein product [Polarella glacialis]